MKKNLLTVFAIGTIACLCSVDYSLLYAQVGRVAGAATPRSVTPTDASSGAGSTNVNLIAGSNITITTNTPGQVYTIASTAGGGSLSNNFATTNSSIVLTNIINSLATNVVANNNSHSNNFATTNSATVVTNHVSVIASNVVWNPFTNSVWPYETVGRVDKTNSITTYGAGFTAYQGYWWGGTTALEPTNAYGGIIFSPPGTLGRDYTINDVPPGGIRFCYNWGGVAYVDNSSSVLHISGPGAIRVEPGFAMQPNFLSKLNLGNEDRHDDIYITYNADRTNSTPLTFHSRIDAGGGNYVYSRPGIQGLTITTNGYASSSLEGNYTGGQLIFYRRTPNKNSDDYYNFGEEGGRMTREGWQWKGSQSEEIKYVLLTNATYTIDFSNPAVENITPSVITPNTTFAGTNPLINYSFRDRKTVYYHGANTNHTLTWPASWRYVGAATNTLPTTLASNSTLRLEFESVGIGAIYAGTSTSNLYVRVEVLHEPFAFDPDVQRFITASGISTDLDRRSVNDLVWELKANKLWNRFTNGFLYPFVGGVSTSTRENLASANYQITWNGTVTHTGGVTGNGAPGSYGNTGFAMRTAGQRTNDINFGVFSASADWGPTGARALGTSVTGEGNVAIFDNGTTVTCQLFGSSQVNIGGTSFKGMYCTARNFVLEVAPDFYATNYLSWASNGVYNITSSAIVGMNNQAVYVLARSDNGSPANESTGTFTTMWCSKGFSLSELNILEGILYRFNFTLGRL